MTTRSYGNSNSSMEHCEPSQTTTAHYYHLRSTSDCGGRGFHIRSVLVQLRTGCVMERYSTVPTAAPASIGVNRNSSAATRR